MRSVLNFILAFCLSVFFLGHANAQIIVVKKPHRPKILVVKTAKPSPNHRWIGGHWKVHNNRYVWNKGHWVKARKHHTWIRGHWKEVHKGWKWIPGHWKRLHRR